MQTNHGWESGDELEKKVKELLSVKNFEFKEQVSLTDFDLRADFLVVHNGNDFVIEVSQRNSNEDIQRTCFRTLVYKNFLKNTVKTIVVVPNFTKSNRSLRLFMFLMKFSDMFLFLEDLDRLVDFLNAPESFSNYLIDKISMIYPESKLILELLKNPKTKLITHEELSEKTNIPLTKIKQLFYNNHLSFEKMGLVEKFGNYCRLNKRFLES